MSTSSTTIIEEVQRPNLLKSLFPSVVSGIVLGVVAAAVAGVLLNRYPHKGAHPAHRNQVAAMLHGGSGNLAQPVT